MYDTAGLIVIYIICGVSLVATIVRLTMVNNYYESYATVERVVNRVQYIYWGIIEIATAITCANIPALPILFRQFKRANSQPQRKQHKGFWIFRNGGSSSSSGSSGNNDKKNNGKRAGPSFMNRFGVHRTIPSLPSKSSGEKSDNHYHHHHHHHHHYHYQSPLDEHSKTYQLDEYPILPLPVRGGRVTEMRMKQTSANTFAINEV